MATGLRANCVTQAPLIHRIGLDNVRGHFLQHAHTAANTSNWCVWLMDDNHEMAFVQAKH